MQCFVQYCIMIKQVITKSSEYTWTNTLTNGHTISYNDSSPKSSDESENNQIRKCHAFQRAMVSNFGDNENTSTKSTQIARFMGQHGAHLGPVGPRWAHVDPMNLAISVSFSITWNLNPLQNMTYQMCRERVWWFMCVKSIPRTKSTCVSISYELFIKFFPLDICITAVILVSVTLIAFVIAILPCFKYVCRDIH